MKMFSFCPACGSSDIHFDGIKELKCASCSFTYFHNIAAAAAAMLEYDGKILFVRRVREPGKGKLDLPGGFIDPNESAEDGLNRELKEELGFTLEKMKYLGSAPNTYLFKGITYNTCDLFFYAKIKTLPEEFDKSEIAALELIDPLKVNKNDLAFKSAHKGIELLLKNQYK
ncbi:MAG: NUDIX domain-containing protein [Sedimentisphaerales bacterium]|nr:NUDIX domain-containing protein [Sedimentisphaerales bacterium]